MVIEIKQLPKKDISKIRAFADKIIIYEGRNFDKNINLSKMSFNNVGTVEQATKFKEVFKMIFSNVLLNINNEIIKGDLKNKTKNKLKNLRNKISTESLKK